MAPPPVIAARRAPRRGRSRPLHLVAVQVRGAPAAPRSTRPRQHVEHRRRSRRAPGRGTDGRARTRCHSVFDADLAGWRRWRRSAARGCRAGSSRQRAGGRARRRAWRAPPRRTAPARRASAGRGALRRRPERVAGAADALQQGRDRARRAEVADQIDVADVDAELERRGRDDGTGIAPLLSPFSAARRVSRDRLPWCAATLSSPSRSPSAWATRSTSRRVLTKTIVVRCARISAAMRS